MAVVQRALVTSLTAAAVAALVLVASAAPTPSAPPIRRFPFPGAVPADASATPDAAQNRDAATPPGPCGRDGGVDCPLQGWMKVNAGPPSKTGDIELLAGAFDGIAALAPHATAYPNWASIAKDGASVARRGRVDAARVACVSCHEQYRARFRQQLRAMPLHDLPDAGEIEGGKP